MHFTVADGFLLNCIHEIFFKMRSQINLINSIKAITLIKRDVNEA